MATTLLPQFAAIFVLVFARVGTLVMLLPGLGEQFVPTRIRLTLALLLTLVFLPLARPLFRIDPTVAASILPALFIEIAIGLLLGIGARMIMAALQIAGTIIAQDLQLSFAQSVDPTAGSQGVVLSNLLTIVGVTLIFVTDLHHLAISAIGASYLQLAPGLLPPTSDMVKMTLGLIATSFTLSVKIAAPFAVFAVVFNIGLGILSRLMPALQVFFLAMPATILIGMLLFLAVIGAMMGGFLEAIGTYLASLNGR